ncbi:MULTISPECIES: ABC transporter substrate-binding protein [Marinobacter]|uniref:ABC transporter substrate-binding protein n=1 Tax=Marinobacter TaxID=2742 RepID=UPI001907549D|nr:MULTISPECIES: glycine betaine ABC transporter substrate-binding protein [unclassified Marinobacter]MBK1887890.1 hypothetical protein [Marinobacter sp. DY40_1A1]
MKITRSVKSIIVGMGLSLGLTGTAYANDKVVIADSGWASSQVMQLVLAEVIKNRLNVDVKTLRLDLNLTYPGMDKGDGTVDILSEFWLPAQQPAYDKYIAKGSRETIVRGKKFTGEQGWYIPGYIQDEYGIKSIYDLVNPETAKLFDMNGNGNGDFWAGAPGWESTSRGLVQAKSYGISEYFEPMEVSDAIMKSQLKKAFRKKQGFLFAYWKPEGVHAEYDLRRLEEPPFTGYSHESAKGSPDYNPDGCFYYITPTEDPEWYEKSEINCTWPVIDASVAYSKSLETRLPEVAQFLSQVSMDSDTVSQWSYEVSANKKEALDVAREWIAANPDVVNGWLIGVEK